jgi:uncharacterized protein
VDESAFEVLVAVAILIGLVGIVVPVLPGALLVWAAVVVWALEQQTTPAWVVAAIASVAITVAQVVKYLLPHRRLRAAGVPQFSIVAGGLLGIVGFFVIPVVGLLVGFVLGIYAAEHRRLRTSRDARDSTIIAMRAVGLSIVIELAGALLAAGVWFAVAVGT